MDIATGEAEVAVTAATTTSNVSKHHQSGKKAGHKKSGKTNKREETNNSDDEDDEGRHNTRCPHLITCVTSKAAEDDRTIHRFTVQPREVNESDPQNHDENTSAAEENVSVAERETSSLPAIREVICDDALKYLASIDCFDQSTGLGGFGPGTCVFTSMPDITELPILFGGYRLAEYKIWFETRAYEILSRLHEGCHAVFLQSDVRMMNTKREVYEWLDKSHLITSAADRAGCTLVWHKLVLINQGLEKRSVSRPSYSHLVCYVRNPPRPVYERQNRKSRREQQKLAQTESANDANDEKSPMQPLAKREVTLTDMDRESAHMYSYRTSLFCVPDIFHRGEMLWNRGIGLDCAYVAVMFLKDVAKCKSILDPFTGVGTVLAMANALGIHAVGVEISRRRSKRAASMTLSAEDLDRYISPSLRAIEMDVVVARREKKEKETKERLEKLRLEQEAALAQEKLESLSVV